MNEYSDEDIPSPLKKVGRSRLSISEKKSPNVAPLNLYGR